MDSNSAGQFVCNDLYYRLMAKLQPLGVPIVLFAHVPTMMDKDKDDVTGAVRAMLESATAMISEGQEDADPADDDNHMG